MSYPTGKNNPKWKFDKLSYIGIHSWLLRDFGKANKCEFCKTLTAKRYDWALKKGYKYIRLRKAFIMLCRSCHVKYDMNKKRKQNNRVASLKRNRDTKGRYV